MKVAWSPLADEQVDDAVVYISGDSPTAALQWLERLLDRVKSLATFPDSGRMVPELGRQGIREIIVSPYRVMYRRKDDLVEIAAVRHEAREFDEKDIAP
ncbi:MAG: type II toxin-antitoxin system RelE/ParE family toxin [Actinomycetota bacterium]|nr:type II toxin-antitoxin system RelE/ParE family toxin [Actinomycetota bacterium]